MIDRAKCRVCDEIKAGEEGYLDKVVTSGDAHIIPEYVRDATATIFCDQAEGPCISVEFGYQGEDPDLEKWSAIHIPARFCPVCGRDLYDLYAMVESQAE